MAPLKLRKKVGLRKDPTIKLVIKTLSNDTHTPVEKPNLNIVNKTIIFAIPGLSPGIGLGKKNSIKDNATAIADSLAIW